MGALEDYLAELRIKEAQRLAQTQANLNDLQLSAKQQDDDITVNQLQGGFELSHDDVRGLSAEERRIAKERFRTETPQILRTRAQQAASQEEQAIRQGEAIASNDTLEHIRQIASLKNMRFTDPQFDATIPRDDALRSQIVIDPKTGAQEVQPKPGLSEQSTRITEFAQRFNLPEEVVRQKFIEDQVEDLARSEKLENLMGAKDRRRLTAARADKAELDLQDATTDRPAKREIELLTQRKNLRDLTANEADYLGDRDLDIKKKEEARKDLIDQEKKRKEQALFATLEHKTRIGNLGTQLTPGQIAAIEADPASSQEDLEAVAIGKEKRAIALDKTLTKTEQGLQMHHYNQWIEGFLRATSDGMSKVYDDIDISGYKPGELPDDIRNHAMALARARGTATFKALNSPLAPIQNAGGIGSDLDAVAQQAEQENAGWMQTLLRHTSVGLPLAGLMAAGKWATGNRTQDPEAPTAEAAATSEGWSMEGEEPQTMGDWMRKLPDASTIPRSSIEDIVGRKADQDGLSMEEWLRRARRQGRM